MSLINNFSNIDPNLQDLVNEFDDFGWFPDNN